MATIARSALGLAAGVSLAAPASAAGGGDKFIPGAGVFLYINNTDAAPHTVTVDDPNSTGPSAGAAFDPDTALVCAANTAYLWGPFPAERFGNNADNGLAHVTYSAVTGMKIMVVQL